MAMEFIKQRLEQELLSLRGKYVMEVIFNYGKAEHRIVDRGEIIGFKIYLGEEGRTLPPCVQKINFYEIKLGEKISLSLDEPSLSLPEVDAEEIYSDQMSILTEKGKKLVREGLKEDGKRVFDTL